MEAQENNNNCLMDNNKNTATSTHSIKQVKRIDLTQLQRKIAIHIYNIAYQTQQGNQITELTNNYEKHKTAFMDAILSLIIKITISQEFNEQLTNKMVQFCLKYVQFIIKQQKELMQDLTYHFQYVYHSLCQSANRSLLVDCIISYLTKTKHRQFATQIFKTYVQRIVTGFNANQINQIQVMFIIEVFKGFVDNKSLKSDLMFQEEELKYKIINQYCLESPSNVNQQSWIKLILIFSNLSQSGPNNSFLFQHMKSDNQNMKMKIRLQIFELFSKFYNTFQNLNEIIFLIDLQLKRISNPYFMKDLTQQNQEKGKQILIMTIKCLIQQYNYLVLAQESETIQYNQIIQNYYSRCQKAILTCAKILQKNEAQSSEVVLMIKKMIEGINNQQKRILFIQNLYKKLTQQNCLFSLFITMQKCLMDKFKPEKQITKYCDSLNNSSCQITNVNYNILAHQIFLIFIINYLKRNDLISNIVKQKIKLFLHFINSLKLKQIDYKYQEYQIEIYKQNIIKLDAYQTSIQLLIQKYQQNRNQLQQNMSKIIQKMCNSFVQIYQSVSNCKQQMTNIICDTIYILNKNMICKQKIYLSMIQYLIKNILPNQDAEQGLKMFVCARFLLILQQSLDIQIIINSKSIQKLCKICSLYLRFNDQNLKNQVCHFILKLLVQLNSLKIKNKIKQQQSQMIINQVKNTQIYQFIRQCYKNQKDELLYCKILMQTLIHQSGKEIVHNILISSCCSDRSLLIGLHTDRVWEVITILYAIQHPYLQKKQINDKVNKIKGQDIESLMGSMNLINNRQYTIIAPKNNKQNENKSVWLREIRKVIEPGSVVFLIIQKKLNSKK